MTVQLAPHSVAPLLLLGWLCLHRFGAHRGLADLGETRAAPRGVRSWTTTVLVAETTAMSIAAVTWGWVGVREPSWAVVALGNGVLAASFLVTRLARRELGEHFSIYLRTVPEQHLVTTGIYGAIRHPLYTGEVLLHLGAALATCAYELLPLTLVSLGLAVIRLRVEESLLAQRFPAEFPAYAASSARLFPGIY